MVKHLLRLALLSVVAILVFAPAAWAQGNEVTVRMEDNFFEPANITVEPGTTVTWVQEGNNPHTTTSYDGLWDSGMIEPGSGGSFSFTFDDPGTFDYFCIPHESLGMIGSVTVSGASASTSASASASASASPSASASASAPALAATGGPSLALIGALLLVGSGVVLFALLRPRTS
jgi:plastocyanin